MISDITLGQFFPGNSLLHKLDPRTKIIIATLFIVSVFTAANPVSFLVVAITVLALLFISGISPKIIVKSVKPIVFIIIFTALINIFMTQGEELLVSGPVSTASARAKPERLPSRI